MNRILVLGGTTEARALCTMLAQRGAPVEVSLAGVAPSAPYPVPERRGGFGGVAGLADYLRTHQIRGVIDATHPFAAQMPWNAAQAASETGTPIAMLKRPAWAPALEDRWQNVPRLEDAAAALPAGARAFLATGAGSLSAFQTRPDTTLILRQLTPPGPLPSHVSVRIARAGDLEAELRLFRELDITHLVAKNSGGPTRAKLDAARALGLPVILVARPSLPDGLCYATVPEVVSWAEGLP